MEFICPHCKNKAEKANGYVNRARKLNVPIYCSKKCSAMARSYFRTDEQKKAIKKQYDAEYRFRPYVLLQKALYFFLDYRENPEKYKKKRQRRMKAHIEYCRQPEYKKYKKQYDQNYRFNKEYGEYAEAAKALLKLEEELPAKKITKYNQGLINKSQKRKRRWQIKRKP